MSFFPKDKEIPKELVFENYKLRQLRATDNDLDYAAVIESGFRPEGFPKEENLEQISRHEKSHDMREEFAYTILNLEETYCYGCLFIKPIVPFLKFAFFNDRLIEDLSLEENNPGFSFWLTPKGWEEGLYSKLLDKLSFWFKSGWSYDKIFIIGMDPPKKEISLIESYVDKQIFMFQYSGQKYLLWQFF
jgi:hypothetical protein